MAEHEEGRVADDPLWYQDAIIYEVHVRAFRDSDGDGIGDFRGLTEKLDYIRDLGVTAIWLLPFYPSPLRDDGYDISEYADVHPAYGTMRDFKVFLREAHRRGIRVITELVLNHTSDQHPWFQRARRSKPGSPRRDFYVWSDTQERYEDARIIFKDYQVSNWTWDPVAKAYYWHRFYSHQPDLNYDSPRVRQAIMAVVDFWLGLGVDGLRLDAVPYLYERDGTSSENLPETHGFLQELRAHVDSKFKNRMLLAEANQWPEDAAEYFGNGDECHMAFHFPLMPRLFMAVRLEDRFPIIEILNQTPAIPATAQWCLFLRNHDELTLEMVTDEERDYMYRMYAQDRLMRINLGIRRRLSPLLENDRKKIELMLGLLISLPGTPVVYYGDELGMGDNFYLGDRNGVRTPMQWSADRNAGFSSANPHKLFLPIIIDPVYHYEALNVEAQLGNPHSLLWWTKRIIARRKQYRAFGRGTLQFLYPGNRRVLAFVRRHEEETILVVANLSRNPQFTELDLSAFKGMAPVEIGGRTVFPPIGELPYLLTLGSYSFYWFSLERPATATSADAAKRALRLPQIAVAGTWRDVLRGRARAALESGLIDHLPRRRWFGGKARGIHSLEIEDVIPLGPDSSDAVLALLRVDYREGEPETYALPLAFATGEAADRIRKDLPHAAIAELRAGEEAGLLFDAFWEKAFLTALLDVIVRHRRLKGSHGDIAASTTRALRPILASATSLEPAPQKAEQSNTSALFSDRLILKLYRRVDLGPNPELEIGWHLTERARFPGVPALAGSLTYWQGSQSRALGVLHAFVPNEGDAWRYTLDVLGRYFERPVSRLFAAGPPPLRGKSLVSMVSEEPSAEVLEAIGPYLDRARLLGERTAELHLALASARDDPDFAPEPFGPLDQGALYHALLALADQTFPLLKQRLASLPEDMRRDAKRILDLEPEVRRRFRSIRDRRIGGVRIRVHGDYHLGQVLYTGKDFAIIDFEGEPARPLSERRIKRSPLRDVAAMVRSFHYAAYAALFGQARGAPDVLGRFEPWARLWYEWVASRFLRAYLSKVTDAGLVPKDPQDLEATLDAYVLEKAVYEVGYELNNRPDWARIPITGILRILEPEG